jgi:hypothetical protein
VAAVTTNGVDLTELAELDRRVEGLTAERDHYRAAIVGQSTTIKDLTAALNTAKSEIGRLRKVAGALPWRAGRRVHRTIYDANDTLIGTMDTPELALQAVAAVNRMERFAQLVEDYQALDLACAVHRKRADAADARVVEMGGVYAMEASKLVERIRALEITCELEITPR